MNHAFPFSVKRTLPVFLLVSLLFLFLLRPEDAPGATEAGLRLCLETVIPNLFPVLVLTGMLAGLGLPETVGRLLGAPFRALFGIGECGACVFFTGILTGFPGGAAMAVRLRDDGLLSDAEASRLCAVCSIPGPAFMIGGIGAGMLGDVRKGAILWGIQLVSSICCGVVFRFLSPIKSVRRERPPEAARLPILPLFSASVVSGVQAMLTVCGSILFFSVLQAVFSGLFAGHGQLLLFLGGLFEISSGCARAAASLPDALVFPVLSVFCAWSGCSVHAQIAGLVGDRFGLGEYFSCRMTQIAFSLLLSFLFL